MAIKSYHKLIAILLTAVLLVSSPLGVFALSEDEDTCNCGYAPTVYVEGFATSEIYRNLGTDKEEVMFPPETETIKSAISEETAADLAKFAVTGDWNAVADALIPAANKVLEDFGCNPDGTVKAGTGIKWSYPTSSYHRPGYTINFNYDWRVDPMEVARQLNDFVEYVCSLTGHDKVNIVAYSMGSIVTMSYIEQFGYDRIVSLVLSAPAFNGVSIAGEPFSGNIDIQATGIARYLDSYLSDDGEGALITALAKVLEKSGATGAGVGLTNYAIAKLRDRIYPEVLAPVFGTLPGMWSFVPDEYYEAAKKCLLSDTVKYAELIKKIDNYHYNVQAHNKDLIDGAIARGIKFGIIAKYGLQGFPCGNSTNNSTDTVIDVKYSSFGATCADLGKTLGSNYAQAVNCGHNHLSPDNQIDASTCKYPEQTWFVKDFVHMWSSDDYNELINYILFSEKQVTVFDNPKYPQFLKMDEKTNTMSPLKAESPGYLSRIFGENSWVVLLYNLFTAVLPYFRQAFSKPV